MQSDATGTFSSTFKWTFAATGSFAAALGGALPAVAAPPGQTTKIDPGRWADAFNGWSVGFGVAYDFFRDPAHVDSFNSYSSPESPTLSGNDPFADVDFGRDFRANNYVFGIYGNLFAGEKTGAFTSSDSYAPSGSLTLKSGGAVTARAGFLTNPQTLVYGLFGWTWQHYSAAVSGTDDSYNPISASESGVLNGPTVGTGLEFLFPNNPNVSFKTEYRYTFFNAPGPLSPDGGLNYITFGKVDDQTLRFILSFKMP